MISGASRNRGVLSLLIAALSLTSTRAALSVTNPLPSQYPQVAHTGKPYSWTFAESTFTETDAAAATTLSVAGLPSWARFDAATRAFSGTPDSGDVARTTVTVRARSDSGEADSDFDLIVVSDDAPVLKSSLKTQLPQASSLGRSQIVDGGKLHIPWGWSFSVGWQGDTFYLPSGAQVFTTATLGGTDALPSWLKYSPTTYAMWGIAPTSPGPEGTEFNFTLTGSNVQGKFGGTQSNLTIVLGTGALSLKGGRFANLNATLGQPVQYTLPTSSIQIDGQQIKDSSIIDITVDTAKASWLSYDSTTKQLSGTPSASDGDPNAVTNATVAVTVTNSLGKSLTTSILVNVFPPAFAGSVLPNVFVVPGKPFTASLASSVRDPAQHNITLTLEPQSASQWILFNSTDLVLSGTAPQMGSSEKVKVTLSSQPLQQGGQALRRRALDDANQPANKASFYISPMGSNPGPAVERPSSGMSRKSKLGLAIGLSIFGGLLALLFLVIVLRRCCTSHDGASARPGSDVGRSPALSDDRTLYGGASPAMDAAVGWTSKKEKSMQDGSSPAMTIVANKSPYLTPDQQRAGAISPGSQLKGILIGGRHYGYNAGDTATAAGGDMEEKPKQHGFMSAIVQSAKKRFPSSKSLARDASMSSAANAAPSGSTGLGLTGLGLEAPESDDPYTQRPQGHSRSRFSLRSSASKESWEEDLFYTSNSANDHLHQQQQQRAAPQPLPPVIEVDEVPTRRSSHGRVSSRANPMRHRNSHINASPAFTTPGTFGAPAPEESSHSHSTDDGELPATMSENFVIGTAQRIDVRDMSQNGSVQSYRPNLMENAHRSVSKHADAFRHDSGTFDDADDDDEQGDGVYNRQSAYTAEEPSLLPPVRRNSAMSTVSADSQVAALAPFVSYPNPATQKTPSIFGGASIASNVRPEDTLKPVPHSSYGEAASDATTHRRLSRAAMVDNLEANVSMGERVRIKLTPPGGAAMIGGAPGSPGKRSSRGGKYLPVLDDVSMQAHGTWPIWLSEWLHWDPRVFELSGEVPLDFELPEVHIALIHRRLLESTASPRGHQRQNSSDSATASVEDQVVVRLTLFIEWPDQSAGSGQQVYLRREGTGNAF
ncbi:unnamed protein product [Parajaminaea phylloscopi]